MLASFELFVDDDRYSVPTLHLISAEDEARARMLAEGVWGESQHHLGVELRQSGERLFGTGSLAQGPGTTGEARAP
ncbi:MAG TPA: hypothetical protein VMU93_09220 [Caulobacteraceae bacterium]|nr:hypothetical protein [Caulobacteraceae bacterium]